MNGSTPKQQVTIGQGNVTGQRASPLNGMLVGMFLATGGPASFSGQAPIAVMIVLRPKGIQRLAGRSMNGDGVNIRTSHGRGDYLVMTTARMDYSEIEYVDGCSLPRYFKGKKITVTFYMREGVWVLCM